MRQFGAILDHFISFFHLLKSKNFWKFYDIDNYSRHEPRECSKFFAVILNADFIKGTISQPCCLEVFNLHSFLQSLYM